ncbi:MAG: lipoyl(octanoyl) transferase LipB [Proteobacteria bacterium]|nr:lipoyl(octanoyl) transferase LipB [Pseudomonadota bacterium]
MTTNQKTTNNMDWKSQRNLVPYEEAHQWMEDRVKALQNKEATECVWLLEHPPLYTLGTSGHNKDVLASSKLPVFKTGRGGQVTYHGPGQRVVYLMLDLKTRYEDIRRYVFELEEWLINTLHHLGIKGGRRPGRVGIWVEKDKQEYKIAALGVRVQKWITSHGIALNVNPDLSHYTDIIPCGLSQYGTTSLADLGLSIDMQEVDNILQKTYPFKPCN